MTKEETKQRLKQLIVEALNLEDVEPDEIEDDMALMEAGLGLDSIDALELVVRLEKDFGVKISNSEEAREALASVNALADFLQAKASA
ncbi:phosphopantetheine-binding protein [Rubellicoccus peritrichatus]|uniref:Phosphopantetheine-binding protein n=1 Tax=Rubellicoccus peritrichatus TaxID=3080537 RepID=A0AAQ3LD60_9BACT|nr:phosphopantetheine-binding protein [Puniceicoccus sp. CR14]WOO42322.1 phosphopantetheine-binding protein [Puniceicoccus sp. CR14]